MKDPAFRDSLREIPVDRRKHPELYLCDMYNHLGSFVRSDLIDEQIYLQTEWYNVNLYWNLLKDVVALGRQNRPYIFENFEWLAARAKRWADEHPQGDYPPKEERLLPEPTNTGHVGFERPYSRGRQRRGDLSKSGRT